MLLFEADVQCVSDGSVSHQDDQTLGRDESLDTMDYYKNYGDTVSREVEEPVVAGLCRRGTRQTTV